jgi:ATP-dependent helicase/nuclease subunit B
VVISDVRVVGSGRPTLAALASTVSDAKRGVPLAPITVVVPSNFVGLSARRLLAGGDLGGRGVANVQFVTPFRLAELLVGDHSTGGRPLTNPVLGAAVRRSLSGQPAPLSAVAENQATVEAFAGLYAELSHVSEATLEVVAGFGGLQASGVEVFRRIRTLLHGFPGEDEVANAVASRSDLGLAIKPFGHVVWYLPEPVTPALARMLRAVFEFAPSTVIVGVTGVDLADAPVFAACERSGVAVEVAATIAAPSASHIVSVSDCDEEVRAAVRRIVSLA